MRTRISLVFTGVLILALVAVIGFAAFSARKAADRGAEDPVESSLESVLPRTASGRVLGAVVAAALTPEPVIAPQEQVSAEPASASSEPLSEPSPEPTSSTTSVPPPTTAEDSSEENRTANATPPDTSVPEIEITFPKDGATVGDRVIEFRGTTEPGADVTSGNYAAVVAENGEWQIKLVLREGRNRAYFTSTDEAGNSQTASVSVVYDPPEPTTTSTTTTTSAPTTTTSAPTTTTSAPTTTTTEPPDTGGPRDVEEWRPLVEQYFPPELVEEALWVIECESNGDPAAFNSRSGASGLFQFIPSTWSWASTKAGWAGASPFDPEANIATAAWLVQWSLDHGSGAWAHWSCRP